MLNSRWYKIKYVSILIVFYILIFTGSNEDALPSNIKNGRPIQHANYILAKSHVRSIDLNQEVRRIWVYQSTGAWIKSLSRKYYVLILLPVLCILSIFIDKYKKIRELCTLRFNGTKYKGWCLLPNA